MKSISLWALVCLLGNLDVHAQSNSLSATKISSPGTQSSSTPTFSGTNWQRQTLSQTQAYLNPVVVSNQTIADLQIGSTNELFMSTLSRSAPTSPSIVAASGPEMLPEQIEMQSDGALARFGPHKVKFKANANASGAVELQLPGLSPGLSLKTRVVGLCYYDPASGDSVMIAQPRDSTGELLPPNKVIYRQALDGADLVYTYTRTSFEQDIVLRASLPDPAALGLNPSTVRLGVLTEIVGGSHPRRAPRQVDLRGKNLEFGVAGEETLPDETLWFGSMRIVGGKAFVLGKSGIEVPSGKAFQTVEGRNFLVEFTPYALIKAQIDFLPSGALQAKAQPRQPLGSLLAQSHLPSELRSGTVMRLAREGIDSTPGVVLDYLMSTAPLINIDFGSDLSGKTGLAAVGQSETDFWNGYGFPGQNLGRVNGLIYSDGSRSPVNLTVANAPGSWGGFSTDPMYNDYKYTGNQNITITLSGLPANHYNLYLYGHDGDPAHNGIYQVSCGGTIVGTKGTGIWGPGSLSTNWQSGQQYALFSNLAVANEDLTITVLPNSIGFAYINGLQLVPTDAVSPDVPNIDSLINVDFGSNPSSKSGPAAVGQSNSDYWNGYDFPWMIAGEISDLKDAAGATTPAGLLVLNAPEGWTDMSSDPMYNNCIGAWDGGNITLQVSSLPAGNYDFYLYGHISADFGNTIFQLWSGGVDRGVKGTSIYGTAWSNTDWEENEQFVRFRDVPVAAGQPVTIIAGHNWAGGANLNGMQIVRKGPLDADSNGLADAWELYFFGQVGIDPAADPDGDGLSNFQEFLLGTCPTNPDSDKNMAPDGADTELVWLEDNLPCGARPLSDNEDWDWESWLWDGDGWGGNELDPYSGSFMHISGLVPGDFHQHYFSSSLVNIMVNPGDVLYGYVNLDPSYPPDEVMLQWYIVDENGNGSWEHRAFWGANNMLWGTDGSESRRLIGPLPDAGTWVRLEVPAAAVGLEGKVIQGMAFSLWGGRAAWDRAGKLRGLPPRITSQPASRTVAAGANVTFWVGATGYPPLSYQWTHNGSAIPGATASSLTLNGGSLTDAGDYKVIVSSASGSTSSAAATLTVLKVAPVSFAPVGASYSAARNVVLSCPTAGATIHYTVNGQEPTASDPSVSAGGMVLVDHSLPLKASAWKSGWAASDTESEGYRIEPTPTDQPPTVTIFPPTGTSIRASDDLNLLVEAADLDGTVALIQLFQNGIKVAESTTSPLQFTLNQIAAGSYTFTAKATDDAGFVTASSSVVIGVNDSGPVVSIHGVQPFFTASPATLSAGVLGVSPGSVLGLTLNGVPLPVRTGSFILTQPLKEGANTFTLAVTDSRNRTAQASTTVYLYSIPPTVSISAPAHGASFNTPRVNVQGTFTSEATLKGVIVNGVPGFVSGISWEALNVPLVVGQNTITATAEDMAGNTASAAITVTGLANPVDPIQLTANPGTGFAPLTVTFTPQASVPGTLQQVVYDFTGDHTTFQTSNDLQPVTHTYSSPGQYFPAVTLVTTAGRFSSTGGWTGDSTRLIIKVQSPPVLTATISITDPTDIKWMPEGFLYVLSSASSTLTEFDTSGTTPVIIRSLSNLGANPTGLDVDAAGNVYVAVTGDHQIKKFTPTAASFALDTTFNNIGFVGRGDKSSGTGSGQFNAPHDVAVMADGSAIYVSDTQNNRIQKFDRNGTFLTRIGSPGNGFGQFNNPKGIGFSSDGTLFVVDSGNSRLVRFLRDEVYDVFGSAGSSPGQYQAPLNFVANVQKLYVADTGNSRIQLLDRHTLATSTQLGSELGLSAPSGVALTDSKTEECLYIADRGNNRVLVVKLPKMDPLFTWNVAKQSLVAGNTEAALAQFSLVTVDHYRTLISTLGAQEVSASMGAIGQLTPMQVDDDEARYYFTVPIAGHSFLFIATFVNENGRWKIRNF